MTLTCKYRGGENQFSPPRHPILLILPMYFILHSLLNAAHELCSANSFPFRVGFKEAWGCH